MLEACHISSGVEAAVDLANTWKPVKGEDTLETVEQLQEFLADHPSVGGGSRTCASRRLTRADLTEVRALRETVRRVLEESSIDAVAAAALINDGLRRSHATPVLRHEDGRWWTEVTSDTDRCAAHLAATTLSALARVIATLGPTRLGVCAGPRCRATYVDLSRNGSKQYCTRTCAHRASVAAYRSRHSTS
ncbi:putative RNA-binding Zn ribbon-like protein [Amycolatopsis echigonensis]|uniref:RNA-binding Zn ribbon-like protein n=1 Tax=Amycolatopsis echigonensis TaxID=2576905 RepID=A0A2N3WU21_9PSEU|nr:CGNR zinc finger domain-containing protein [Amycolatopsis niigatensis]PKV97343.1 putative RNA-binding Zn ribbon-like protein [Amycolatopsis niigatensis]